MMFQATNLITDPGKGIFQPNISIVFKAISSDHRWYCDSPSDRKWKGQWWGWRDVTQKFKNFPVIHQQKGQRVSP
mgnify:CR=1 FL=1